MCVASYGTSKDFPAFFTPRSGFSAPYNVKTAKDAAKLIGRCSQCVSVAQNGIKGHPTQSRPLTDNEDDNIYFQTKF